MKIDYYGTPYMGGYTDIGNAGNTTDTPMRVDSGVCPCCGKRVRLVDSSKSGFNGDDDFTVNESTMNENKLSDYLIGIIETEARNIFEDEIDTEEPETDSMGNIVDDYGERFLYVPKSLKKIIKTKANMISNLVKQQGIVVSPFYVENEIFQCLKMYGYGKR